MEGYDEATYGDRVADVYDDWFGDLGDVDACVARLLAVAEEAHRGRRRLAGVPSPVVPRVLELGIGTGRLALPLAAAGLDVRGVDSSGAMLAALRAKPGAGTIVTDQQDMAAVTMPRRAGEPGLVDADLVFVAFNTFFNLPDDGAQRRCLERVATLLAPDGRFLLEAFVPDLDDARERHVSVRALTADRVVLTATVLDADAQGISGQYIDITEAGVRLRPWRLHYLTVEQLDAMASDTGLVLEDRWADYERRPFDPAQSLQHVSVYRRAEEPLA